MTAPALDHIADDIRHITDIIKAENDTAHTKRLDLLQADLEALMRQDIDGVIERVVRARNNALATGRG